MSEQKKKRRLRSVILVSAVSAIACGGHAEDSGSDPSEGTAGDGDGDGTFIGDVGQPVGDPVGVPDYVGTGGSVGATGGYPGTGGIYYVGIGGFVGTAPTGGALIGDPVEMGGMGGATDQTVGEPFIGVPR